MLAIRIICVGKIKERFMRDAAEEYLKRLSRYAKVSVAEVPDEKAPEHLSGAERMEVLDREGAGILGEVRSRDYVIALTIDGTAYDSVGFSRYLEELMSKGISSVDFVIGGSLGLSEKVLSRADACLSFSKMTFPHQLMRIILLEQIYRAFRIMKHEPYHK